MGTSEKGRRSQLRDAITALCEANDETWSYTVSAANGGHIVITANAPVEAPVEAVAAPSAPAPVETGSGGRRGRARS